MTDNRQWLMFAGGPANGRWLTVVFTEFEVKLYGRDECVPVVVTEDAEGDYFGWIDSDTADQPPVMIQPHKGMFDMQFPYGPQAEVDRGKGEIVKLRVEPDPAELN